MAVFQRFLFLFNSKYRPKWTMGLLLLMATASCLVGASGGVKIGCEVDPESEFACQNNGVCTNSTSPVCTCPPGWAGPYCQFCYGKVKVDGESGWISDGVGNYTANMKCTWLIESGVRIPGPNGSSTPSPIILHLQEFATECCWDHLYIYDGDNVHSPVLAVFSGLLVQKNYKVQLPEVVAKSGYALVHFYTDVAYNLTGFNITYRTGSCPSQVEDSECSGNGVCQDGSCTCDPMYTGDACDLEKCPNNCSTRGICNRNSRKCECFEGFRGHDCSQLSEFGYWESHGSRPHPDQGSTSHAALIHNDTLWVIGGSSLNFDQKDPLIVSKYHIPGQRWEGLTYDLIPNVYGHSAVLFESKIYVYGGVHDGSLGSRVVSDQVWTIDVQTEDSSRTDIQVGECKRNLCGPLALMGHSATLIPGLSGNKTRNSRMVVIFGHSPTYGYANIVQEYHFGSGIWDIVQTKGYPVSGSYAHSSTWDPPTQRIYVYGGYRIGPDSAFLSSSMFSYDPYAKTWYLLESGPSGRFLHAGIGLNGLILIFGGNGHNDTAYSLGSKCFTKKVLIYDINCDSWSDLNPPPRLPFDLARYGHSATPYKSSIYIFGGFNGFALRDLISYTPPICPRANSTSSDCGNTSTVKCAWNDSRIKCQDANTSTEYNNELCPDLDRKSSGSGICGSFKSCSACTQNVLNCVWCGGHCEYTKCKESAKKGLKRLDQCEDESFCAQLIHNCHLCASEVNCMWNKDDSCVKQTHLRNETSDGGVDESVCSSCSGHSSCTNCTSDSCLWCNNLNVCVDKNSYVISFPYGQCMSWSQSPSLCLSKDSKSTASTSHCEDILSCDKCLSLPSCGWCESDTESERGTGKGSCMDGSSRYPLTVNETGVFPSKKCQLKSWHFTSCPLCQCNGHSKCEGDSKCIECDGNTEGDSCETCKNGFFGNPANGGSCSPCECFAHADTCNPLTGRCYCKTKGITGDHCDRCDSQNNYSGDPANDGSCFYDLQIDYQFTFNLSKKEDRYYTQINFRNTPTKADLDADFQIICSISAKMNISVKSGSLPERSLLTNHNCTQFKHRFAKTDYPFGNMDNTTFFVFVYDFQPPLWIQISFAQSPKLDLLHFFITFSTCFLFLLLVAAVLWKIKQKYDERIRRQRLFVEMEQMASRPFAQVYLEIPKPSLTTRASLASLRRRRKEWPSPIALEPVVGGRAAVLSLLVSLPTGSHLFAPPGQSGLCVGSSLVSLSNPRKMSFDPIASKNDGKNSKLRKSLPSHNLSTCI